MKQAPYVFENGKNEMLPDVGAGGKWGGGGGRLVASALESNFYFFITQSNIYIILTRNLPIDSGIRQ